MKLFALLILVLSFQGFAQSPVKPASFNPGVDSGTRLKLQEVVLRQNDNYVASDKSRVPSTILKNFSSKYADATNISWFVSSQSYTVSFNAEEQTIILKYNTAGELLFTKKIYGEDKLNLRISALLKEEVSSLYKVKYITEVERGETIDYNIELSNDKYWLIIRYNFNKTSGKTELTGRHMFGQ